MLDIYVVGFPTPAQGSACYNNGDANDQPIPKGSTMRLIPTLFTSLLVCTGMSVSAFAGDDALPNAGAGGKHGKHHEKLLAKFDANHDGTLDESERATAHAALAARLKEKRPELLAKIDTNNDGLISQEEMKAGRELLKASHQQKKQGEQK